MLERHGCCGTCAQNPKTSDPKFPTGGPAGVEDVERVVGLDVDAVVPSPSAENVLEVEVALRRIQARHAVRGALKDGWKHMFALSLRSRLGKVSSCSCLTALHRAALARSV